MNRGKPHLAIPRQQEGDYNEQSSPSTLTGGSILERTPDNWWWWVLGGLFILIFGLGFWDIFDSIARPLGLFVLGMTLAFAIAPIVVWMQRWIPRVAAIVIIYLLILALVIGLGFLLYPSITQEAQAISEQAPQFVDQVRNFIPAGDQISMDRITNTFVDQLGTISSSLISLPISIGTYIFEILLVFFISAYLLEEGPRLMDFLLTLFPEERRDKVDRLMHDMGSAMGGYIRGTIIDATVVGLLVYFGLLLIGYDYPLLLAIQAGLFELIPNIGPVLSAIPIGLVGLLHSPTQALLGIGLLTLIQQLEGYFLVPFIMRSQTNISPLMVIMALVIGAGLGGLLGVLVAIPLTAALRIFILRVAAPQIRRWMGVRNPELAGEHEHA